MSGSSPDGEGRLSSVRSRLGLVAALALSGGCGLGNGEPDSRVESPQQEVGVDVRIDMAQARGTLDLLAARVRGETIPASRWSRLAHRRRSSVPVEPGNGVEHFRDQLAWTIGDVVEGSRDLDQRRIDASELQGMIELLGL